MTEKAEPKFPYVKFKVLRTYSTGEHGHTTEQEDVSYLRLDTTFGTQDHVLRYAGKPNFSVIGCANLDMANAEHVKIAAFVDSVSKGVAAAKKAESGIKAKAAERGVQ